jgi:drug/metabolite transporter (DMT)-like permease
VGEVLFLVEARLSGGGRHGGVVALLIAVTIWGSTFVVTKSVLGEAGPFFVTAARFFIGLAVLLPFALRAGFRFGLATRPVFLLFGLTGVALYFGLQNLGLLFTSAGSAALIQAGVPAAAALFAFVFLKEHIPPLRLSGIGLSMAGVLLVSGAQARGGEAPALLGNLLIVGSVLAYGAYTVQGRALRTAARYPATVATAASFASGLLFLSPLLAVELLLTGGPKLSTQGWMILLYLGVGASALTLLLWNYALGSVAASAAALYVNLVPVVGLLFALAFGERVAMTQLLGGALAIGGVVLGEAADLRKGRDAYGTRPR